MYKNKVIQIYARKLLMVGGIRSPHVPYNTHTHTHKLNTYRTQIVVAFRIYTLMGHGWSNFLLDFIYLHFVNIFEFKKRKKNVWAANERTCFG